MNNPITIIDPAATEWNRGSFCYLPYLLCDALRYGQTHNVTFLENFTLPETESVNTSSDILIALWSPTQKDLCLELHRLFPNAVFFGYYGIIEDLGLPVWKVPENLILLGMEHQGRSFETCKSVLLSDCDSHLKGEYKGKFYPMHTSYGCPNGCSFCPSSKNMNRKVLELSLLNVGLKIERFAECGYKNIHFTDEDLFLNRDRAATILRMCESIGGFNLIALAHSRTVLRFINKYGIDLLRNAGIRLLEIGFEGQTLLEDKGENHIEHCIKLVDLCPDLVYWLTMTFAPGETIQNIVLTGDFLRKYGRKPDEMLPRLRTNGTEGGLGQFFQAYPDLCSELKGLVSPFNATRLFPSFIPESFLQDTIKTVDSTRWNDFEYWCELYNLKPKKDILLWKSRCIEEILPKKNYIQAAETCIMLAIAARLKVIG